MTLKPALLSLFILVPFSGSALSQAASPSPAPTPRVSDQLSRVLSGLGPDSVTPREQKEKAYAKMLEGQRYVWSGDRLRSAAGRQNSVKLAKQAFQESVELDPLLLQ